MKNYKITFWGYNNNLTEKIIEANDIAQAAYTSGFPTDRIIKTEMVPVREQRR